MGLSFQNKKPLCSKHTGRGPTNREGKGGPRGGYGPYPPPPKPPGMGFLKPPKKQDQPKPKKKTQNQNQSSKVQKTKITTFFKTDVKTTPVLREDNPCNDSTVQNMSQYNPSSTDSTEYSDVGATGDDSTVQNVSQYNTSSTDSTEYSDVGVAGDGSVCTSVRSGSAQKQVLMQNNTRSNHCSNIHSKSSDYQVTPESRDIPDLGENNTYKED